MHVEITFTDQTIVIPPLALPSREIGARIEFQGIVRELEHGEPLAWLHYEAYDTDGPRPFWAATCSVYFRADHCRRVRLYFHASAWVPRRASALHRCFSPSRCAVMACTLLARAELATS
jgi:molybdopterin synthase catalytic subunit